MSDQPASDARPALEIRQSTLSIHRGLRRASTAILIIIVALLGITATALYQMRSAEKHLRAAETAQLEAEKGRALAAEARLATSRQLFDAKL